MSKTNTLNKNIIGEDTKSNEIVNNGKKYRKIHEIKTKKGFLGKVQLSAKFQACNSTTVP